ncbi:MAG: hypothetical protein HZA67_10480 [Rhodospirillales bacterium]|nr:hypothetical protein [Rhodospirillales bacterium]
MQKPKAIFAQALGALLTFGLREWALLVAPTIVCMSLILSIGPTLQHFVVGLLNSTAPTIYGTAFGESVTKFPELLFWLGEGFRWVFLLMASLVVILSFRSRGFRAIVVGIGAYSFLVLSFNDIFTSLIKGTLTFSDMLTDVTANLGGSVLIAFIISAMLWLYEQIFGLMEGNNKFWAQISASLVVLLFGFLISGISYFLSQYIYNPLSVRIDVRANAPISNSCNHPVSTASG